MMAMLVTAFMAFIAVAGTAGARMMRKDEMRVRQAEVAKRWQRSSGSAVLNGPTNVKRSGVQNITFSNRKASGEFEKTDAVGPHHNLRHPWSWSEFWVDGSALPFVDFDVGPSWAGLLPINSNLNETRQVVMAEMSFGSSGANIPMRSSSFGFFLLVRRGVSMTSSFGTAVFLINEYELDHVGLGRTAVQGVLRLKVFSKRTGSVSPITTPTRGLITFLSLFPGHMGKQRPP